jgi:hypothetical protein
VRTSKRKRASSSVREHAPGESQAPSGRCNGKLKQLLKILQAEEISTATVSIGYAKA